MEATLVLVISDACTVVYVLPRKCQGLNWPLGPVVLTSHIVRFLTKLSAVALSCLERSVLRLKEGYQRRGAILPAAKYDASPLLRVSWLPESNTSSLFDLTEIRSFFQ